jgi:hypothetical protein
MVASRIGPKGGMPFGLGVFCIALMPTQIGYQDLAALLARQPAVSARWRQHVIASPFGTIHAATFSFSRPVGTAMPEPPDYRLANFDPRSLEATGALAAPPPAGRAEPEIEYPTVNRALKGDRLPVLAPPEPEPESLPQLQPVALPPLQPAEPPPEPSSTAPPQPDVLPRPFDARAAAVPPDSVADAQPQSQAPAPGERAQPRAGNRSNPAGQPPGLTEAPDNIDDPELAAEEAVAADLPPDLPSTDGDPLPSAHAYVASLSYIDGNPATRRAQIYFGTGAMGGARGLEQWAPGAEPILVSPALVDPDIKLSALAPVAPPPDGAGETVVNKGDVQSEVNRPQTPAERLGLTAKARAKAEKCLADAVYFESRGEPLRGQMAVAQVVMNRVFSGFYPNNVCGVVYQNAHRRLACQFTFACDGIRDRVTEPDMWVQAKHIAKDALDGKIWLPEVGHATHYHAYWVRPSWVHEMRKMYKLGVHTFYRPRAWGNGADEPAWGNLPAAIPAAAKTDGAGAKPEAAGGKPEAAIGKDVPTAKL